ncbi:MAG: TerC family protein [Bacteroidetes bacterium]|nr:MAG: TerC family protein [Bacteroidota bacterium]
MPAFSSMEVWMSLLTLTFLEIVLGIDNIIFISIASGKLKKEEQPRAINLGLILAMAMRILLLFGITWLVAMEEPWFTIETELVHGAFSGQSLILFLGGIFLLYKSTTEIHHKLDGDISHVAHDTAGRRKSASLLSVVIEITVINIVFSFDSILTAVGMTNGLHGALVIMIIAVVLSVGIMMGFAAPVGRFVNRHPSIQMLGLSFLILIGFMLIAEAAHLGHLEIAGTQVGSIPKGYLYFAITFSLFVEFLNMRFRKKQNPVQLHGIGEEAKLEEKKQPNP